MRTRTLLLLSLACGLAILLAGVALLIQLVNRADVAPPHELGEQVQVGDMTVVVQGSEESTTDGVTQHTVQVTIGGVDDPTGTEGFQLNAAGRWEPLVASCGATMVEPAPCELVFAVAGDGQSRQLVYRRGDQSARWVLSAP